MHRFVGLAALVAGCGLSLDLSPEDPPRGDGAVSIDGGDRFDAGRDGATEDGAIDAGMDAFSLPDAGPCVEDVDCAGRPRSGAPTECNAWACVEGFCVENDYDGDGVGPGCADLRDCDDLDPTVGTDGVVACPAELSRPGICGASAYRECVGGVLAATCEGFAEPIELETCNALDDDCDGSTDEDVPSETFGVGRCAESLTCVDGAWRGTAPATDPNDTCGAGSFGVDDDCDGVVDEDCAPTRGDCVFVRPMAGAEPMDPTDPRTPVGTLDAAFAYAQASGLARICLLASSGAGARECSPHTFTMPRTEVANDVTVLGGLRSDAAGTVTRCSTGAEATRLAPLGTAGIAVPSGVTLTLRDLVVSHPTVSGAVVATALDVRGGGSLVMSNVRVRGGDLVGNASTRRGVRVQAGGSLSASACRIEAGPGATGYAIDSVGGAVTLLSGCVGPDCAPTCGDPNRGVFGGRPGAGARVSGGTFTADRTAFCGASSRAGIEVLSTAQVNVLRSLVELGPTAPASVDGISAVDCDALWVHDTRIRASVSGVDERSYVITGIDVAGGCPALLTDNLVEGVTGVGGPDVSNAFGVRCVGSSCALVGNTITGAAAGVSPDKAKAVSCEAGCTLVASRNTLVGATADASEGIGLSIDDASAVVGQTRFVGGCADIALGARVLGGRVRLASNEGVGALCTRAPSFATGLAVEGANISSNGNSYDGGRTDAVTAECNSAGLAFSAETRSSDFRNDVFVAGDCRFQRALLVQGARPLTLTHSGFVGTYYEVSGDREVTDAAGLLALAPLFVGHVFTNAPGFVDRASSLRITAGSPFARAGTRLGAPRVDFSGRPRPIPPSIGAWEP